MKVRRKQYFAACFFAMIISLGAVAQNNDHDSQDVRNVYALIVGVNKYDHEINHTLNYSDDDAMAFKELLLKGYAGRVNNPAEDIIMYTNDSATCGKLDAAIDGWLRGLDSKVEKNDAIFVYWSGHGRIGTRHHSLMCKDTRPLDRGLGDFDASIWTVKIRQHLDQFAANGKDLKVFLIVDACRNKSFPDLSSERANKDLNDTFDPGDIYFYACGGDQKSYETNFLSHSVFTYFLLLGLQGGANGGFNPDNKITLGEMDGWLRNIVRSYMTKVLDTTGRDEIVQSPMIGVANADQKSTLVLTVLPQEIVTANMKKYADLVDSLNRLGFAPNSNARGMGLRSKGDTQTRQSLPRANTVITEKVSIKNKYDLAQRWYDSVMSAIARHHLVDPPAHAAAEYYDSLALIFPKSSLTAKARVNYLTALLESVYALIDAYLEAKLLDTRANVFARAQKELEKALTLVSERSLFKEQVRPYLMFLEARKLAGSHFPSDWTEGLRIIDEALKIDTTRAYMYHTKGILFYNKSRYFSAIRLLDSALLYSPNWNYAYYNLALSYFKIHERDISMSYCDTMLRRDSSFSRAWSLKGAVQEAKSDKSDRDYAPAIESNLRALALDARNTTALNNLGSIYSKILMNRAENIQRSAYYYRMGAELGDATCMAMLAKSFYDQGPPHYDSARYYFFRALSINPFNVVTLRNYSWMLSTDDADEMFDRVLKFSNGDYKIANVYRSYVFRNKSPQKADEVFQNIVKVNKEDPAVFIDHSHDYEGIDSLQKAIHILNTGLFYIPNSPSLLFNMSKLQYKLAAIDSAKGRALDSAIYFAELLRNKQPGYSLNNYNLFYMLGLKHKTDSSLLKSAQRQNSSVANTEVIDKYDLPLKLANTYYLHGELDAAKKYCKKAGEYYDEDLSNYLLEAKDSAYILRQKQLTGLIELERRRPRSYRRARLMFDELDEFREQPTRIEQAVCLFLLNKQKAARVRLLSAKNGKVEAYNEMIANEGKLYSPFFIHQLKALVRKYEGDFFDE